jgi:hypothetical protein
LKCDDFKTQFDRLGCESKITDFKFDVGWVNCKMRTF